jgi:hypothetical protein
MLPSGVLVWARLPKNRPVGTIISALVARFLNLNLYPDVPMPQIRTWVLIRKGGIRLDPGLTLGAQNPPVADGETLGLEELSD